MFRRRMIKWHGQDGKRDVEYSMSSERCAIRSGEEGMHLAETFFSGFFRTVARFVITRNGKERHADGYQTMALPY